MKGIKIKAFFLLPWPLWYHASLGRRIRMKRACVRGPSLHQPTCCYVLLVPAHLGMAGEIKQGISPNQGLLALVHSQ